MRLSCVTVDRRRGVASTTKPGELVFLSTTSIKTIDRQPIINHSNNNNNYNNDNKTIRITISTIITTIITLK